MKKFQSELLSDFYQSVMGNTVINVFFLVKIILLHYVLGFVGKIAKKLSEHSNFFAGYRNSFIFVFLFIANFFKLLNLAKIGKERMSEVWTERTHRETEA